MVKIVFLSTILLISFHCFKSSKLVQLEIPLNSTQDYLQILKKHSQSIDEISSAIITHSNLKSGLLHAEWIIHNYDEENILSLLRKSNIEFTSSSHKKQKKQRRYLETLLDFNYALFKLNSSRKIDSNNVLKHYFNVEQVYEWLHNLELNYSKDILKVLNIGKSYQNRDLKVLKIGLPKNKSIKRAFWFDAGIHAREWTTINAIVYLIDRLLFEFNNRNNTIVKLLTHYDLFFLPIFNPDGYHHSLYEEEFWRKNMRDFRNHSRSTCFGVDLNRNFDYDWSKTKSIRNRCSEDYPGVRAHSEPEVEAVVEFMTNAPKIHKIRWYSYVTIHSYGGFWLTSWDKFETETKTSRTSLNQFTKSCLRPMFSLKKLHGLHNYNYRYGVPLSLIGYSAYGTSDSYFYMKHNISYSYTIELSPNEIELNESFKTHGFHVHENEISGVVKKAYTALYEYLRLFVEKVALRTKREYEQECNELYYEIHEFYRKYYRKSRE